jgi:hypothetical protein
MRAPSAAMEIVCRGDCNGLSEPLLPACGEKVGMRGPLQELRVGCLIETLKTRGEAASPRPSPRTRGEGAGNAVPYVNCASTMQGSSNVKSSRRATDFACGTCGSVAVVYPDQLSDDAPVKCQRCQAVLCTLAEFRLVAGRKLTGFESSVARNGYAFFMPSPRSPRIDRWYWRLARFLGGGSTRSGSNGVTAWRTAADSPD